MVDQKIKFCYNNEIMIQMIQVKAPQQLCPKWFKKWLTNKWIDCNIMVTSKVLVFFNLYQEILYV